jgi:hypothetical protein
VREQLEKQEEQEKFDEEKMVKFIETRAEEHESRAQAKGDSNTNEPTR